MTARGTGLFVTDARRHYVAEKVIGLGARRRVLPRDYDRSDSGSGTRPARRKPAEWGRRWPRGVPDPVEKIVQLKSDLYYVPGAGANAVIRVTPEGLILIDTKNPGREIAAALVAQIKSISDLPVKYVLNTHHHPDHTGNNQTFVEQGA